MTVVAITGHRPGKIADLRAVEERLKVAYHDLGVTHVIQGMAAGVDLASAHAAWVSQIPYTCARPWATHAPRKIDEVVYAKTLEHAAYVKNVSDSERYSGPWLYQDRNEWMVDNASLVIAVWDGTSGGTANCVNYALDEGKYVYRIDPNTLEGEWLHKE